VIVFLLLLLAASIYIQILGQYTLFYPISLLTVSAIIFFLLHSTIRLPRFIPTFANVWVLLFLLGLLMTYPFFSSYPDALALNDTWFFADTIRYQYLVYFLGGSLSTLISWHYLRAMIYKAHKRNIFPSIGPMAVCTFASLGICSLPQMLKPFELIFIQLPQNPSHFSWNLMASCLGSVISAFCISAFDR